jgi:uncharacterized membrane protein YdjX (TVP38/TMEM64 family)
VARDRTSTRAGVRFAMLLVFVAATGAFALWRARHGLPLTPEAVRATVTGWGPLAPVIFMSAWALRPVLFFPTTLLFVGGGLAFGALWGTLYSVIGGTLGGALTFALARALGREFVRARVENRFPELHEERWGPGLVFLLNLIPIVPITAINYGAGLSRIGLGSFILAVVAGLTPRAFAYSFFGSSILDVRSPKFVGALVLLLALIVIPTLLRRRFMIAGDKVKAKS